MLEVQQKTWIKLANQILLDLQKIQPYCGMPTAAVYADNLLRTMSAMRDQSPFEPLTEVVMALHDAMLLQSRSANAFQNRWIDYNANQYKGAHSLLATLLDSQISNDDVEQAILALEDLGFDTLPFGVELNADSDIEENED